MPWNGTGTFSRIYSWVTDAANGIFVRSDRMDTDSDDIANGISNCIAKDGQSTITANIPFSGFKITGLGTGSASTDAVNYGQVFSGGTFTNPTMLGTVTMSGATTVTVPTATAGDNSTKAASTAFVQATAFSAALPTISAGVTDYFTTNNGTTGSWGNLLKTGTIRFADSTDTTKRLAFDISGFTTGNTRTFILPDKNGTLVTAADVPGAVLYLANNYGGM
jgi:hypothetical protein